MGAMAGPKFDAAAYQDKVMEAKQKVEEFEVTADDVLAMAKSAATDGTDAADIKMALEKSQATLMELQKFLTSEITEMRKGGPQATSFVTEISKLSPRLMKLRPTILTELGKMSKLAGNAGAAKKAAETAAAQKEAEEKDAKELSDALPAAQELVSAAEDATESLSILASPLIADPPEEAGDILKDAMSEIETATAEAQNKIAEARKEINLKLQAARKFAPETRKQALTEFSTLQQKLTEAQKKLNPYKNFRTSFKERVEAKKSLKELSEKIDSAELEVEKASMMTSASSQGQMSEDEISSAEKILKPAQVNLTGVLKLLDMKTRSAQEGPLKDELSQLKEKAAGIKKKLDASSAVLKTQLEGVAVQKTVRDAGEKVQKAEEALEKTQEAEMPFLKGIEVLPAEESAKAISDSETAAAKAEGYATQASSFIKNKLAAAKSYGKETQKIFTDEMEVLQKRLEETVKKIDAFKKETLERKMAAFMSEVMESVTAAEDKVKVLTEAAEVLAKDDLDSVSVEALKEALEKTKAAEKEAQAACAEARKTMGAKTAAAKAKGGEMLAAVGKVQGRLNTAQQDLAKARRACLNGEKLVKTKEVITAQEAKIKETEEEVDKLEATSNPAESGLGDEKLSDDTISKIDTGVKDAQKSLKESARLVEAQIPGASASLKPALEQLRDRSKKCQDVISKILAATKDQRERVVSEGYVREATAKTEELEKGMDKVNAAELPFLKGLEVLPLQEAQDTIKNSNSIAADVQKQVTDARSYIAAKSLEVKKFTETVSQPAVEEFTKLTERINGTASKLSQFRKDTEGRTRAAQLQEAEHKVEQADEEIKKLAELIEPLAKEDAVELSGEAAAEACDKMTAAVKAAQASVDGARVFVAARGKEAKEPAAAETVKKLQQQIADMGKRLGEAKKAAATHEGKLVQKKVLYEADQVIAAFEEEVKKATGVCAPLLEEEGIDFLVACSAHVLADALSEHAAGKEGMTEETIFQQIGGTSEDAFVAWLAALPEKIEREEVNFPEERRKAIFKHLDSAKTGSITLENFKDMFKRRFTCVKQISVTDVFEIAKSKTTSKIEPGEVLESTGMAGARADEGGMTRIECRIVSSGAVGFVTVKGNEGTKYLDEVTAFSAFTVGMDKALAEASKAINKASGFLSQKAKELSASTPGPLAEARAELLKLRPKVTSASQSLDTMKRKTVLAKAAFVKREAEERNAHIVAKEKKEADAVLAVARVKVDPMEACARKLEEAAAPVLAAGSELEAFPTPAAALQDVMQLFNDVTGCVGEAKACLKEETEKIRKVLKGPILDAQRELKKMQMRCETLAKECKGTVDKVKKACSTISAAKSALISTAMRAEVQKRGITVEALFDELAASSDRISEEAFCKHASAAVDGAALQPEHVLLVARGIEADGAGKLPSGAEAAGISRRRFVAFVQRYYTVVKPIAITDVLDVTKGKTRRKAEVNEVIEVLEGPCVDEKLKMSRIRGKALSDSVEGWISVQGNQGTPFLTEAQKPYYCCTAGAPLEKDFQTTEPPVRELRPDEIVELLEGPKKEAFAPALRARGKACKDQAQGWFTARDKKGTVMAEADAKYYSCVTSVAMTDELDVKSCKVVRKLAVGELFVVTEGPVEEKEAGITRIKGKALKDEAEGWITSKGNAGTVYAEPSKKHWSIVQEQPMTKAFKSNGPVEEVRSLEAGEAVLLLEGPKEEAFPPDVRIKGRALSDGAIGWITLKGTTVKKWSLFYKVLKSGPAHDARSPEGAQVLRETTAGEVAEWLEGPVEEGKELRIKAKLQKDGVIGWVSVRDAEGNKLMENAA